jgi:hypothetical protein
MFSRTPWAVDGSILKSLLKCNMPMQMMMMSLLLYPQGEVELVNPACCTGVAIGINMFQRYVHFIF